tara:strand:- start:699 stop:1535 length:837 start_codon:yes stop_codon:yes gene_type:complete
LLKKNKILKKICLKLSEEEFQKSKIIEVFENIIFVKKRKFWEIEIFTSEVVKDYNQIKNLFKIDVKKIKNVKKKNWLLQNHNNDCGIETNLFFFSQGLKKKNQKKNQIIIHNSRAFGTGRHESTYLAIKNIESITKKRKFKSCCDVGSGSGILSFVLRKITMKKVIATDIDFQSEKVFFENRNYNHINGINFYRCDGLNSYQLKKIKFDLIVSNTFSNILKKHSLQFRKKLKLGGVLIISGILISQKNELVAHFSKINLKLIKNICLKDWVSLIFIRK